MRYICVVVHPTNEQLNSGLVPRWALCGWLINSCTNPTESANLKLALYFDWLMYDAKKDNIMLIEPAILLMYNSIRPTNALPGASASLTAQLFDFLCRISIHYHWPIKDQILNGIMHSFKDVIDKRVIPSIQTFFTESQNSKFGQQFILDRDLKNLIQATFGTFFQTLGMPAGSVPAQPVTPIPSVQQQGLMPLMTTSPKPSLSTLNSDCNVTSSFSSFKRQVKTEGQDSEPTPTGTSGSPSNSFASIDSTAESPSFKSYFSSLKNADQSASMDVDKSSLNNNSVSVKTEAPEMTFKLETSAQFSSDEDSNDNTKSKYVIIIKLAQIKLIFFSQKLLK